MYLRCNKYMFITSGRYNGNLGGLEGADGKCQQCAEAAGLPGTYMAWLSDNTSSPSSRFTKYTLPYVLTNGTVVADGWDDLTDGSALAVELLIDMNQNAVPMSPLPWVWSNTRTDGSVWTNDDCSNWTSGVYNASIRGQSGAPYYADHSMSEHWVKWTQYYPYGCNSAFRIYCFEQ